MSELSGSYLWWGPPGTGKTTMISRQVEKLVESHGPHSVLIASLTRAAAAEVAGRRLPIPRQMIGTLHAHCYRALGNPVIAESKLDDWNSQSPNHWQITCSAGENVDDAFPEQSGKLGGDQLLNEININRVKMVPISEWRPSAKAFHDKFEDWKNQNGYFSFVDLIEYSLRDIDVAPGRPQFIIVDESQDMDRLSVALVKKWAKSSQAVIYGGDAWQCQPIGTRILTNDGYVRIEDLSVAFHRLLSWPIGGPFVAPIGFPYWIKQEHYDGEIFTVEAAGNRTSGTADHLWVIDCSGTESGRYQVCRSGDLPTSGFSVPVIRSKKGTRIKWAAASVTRSHYSGPIFSLRVEPYHTYVADGIVTHNCIYSWRGSDPNALDYIDDPSHIKVLSQSYRLPRQVHSYAMRWMQENLSTYQPLSFRPRDEEGEVVLEEGLSYLKPRAVARLAGKYADQGKSVMVLASCSYQIYDIVAALKDEGIPFHNPYRRRRGDWNLLHVSRGVSTAEKILSFLKADKTLYSEEDGYASKPGYPPWPVEDLQNFVSLLDSKNIMKRGAKKQIDALNSHDTGIPYTLDDFGNWFTDEAWKALIKLDTEWLAQHIIESKRRQTEYPFKIINRYGAKRLKDAVVMDKDLKSVVVPGTIHSTKGGEASVVILVPDISVAGWKEYKGSPESHDSIARLFYVGMTRAKEKLIILDNATGMSVDMPSREDL